MVEIHNMDMGTCKKIVEKVQRLVAIGITVAIKTTPQAAYEVLLNLQSLDLIIKAPAAKRALRLREPSKGSTPNQRRTE